MPERMLQLEIPEELWRELERVTRSLGLGEPHQAALIAVADWVARRRAELDDRDPGERYFVNEALDALENKK
ncbi:MAG: hypothetical protein ACREQX_19035 [Candidatus Binataceae bacterium]